MIEVKEHIQSQLLGLNSTIRNLEKYLKETNQMEKSIAPKVTDTTVADTIEGAKQMLLTINDKISQMHPTTLKDVKWYGVGFTENNQSKYLNLCDSRPHRISKEDKNGEKLLQEYFSGRNVEITFKGSYTAPMMPSYEEID